MTTAPLRRTLARALGAGALCLAVAGAAAGNASGAGRQVVVKTHHTAKLGTYLTTLTGMPLYTRTPATRAQETCNATCLKTWPALTIARATEPAGTSHLGSVRMSNGHVQVTWRSDPLYRFAGDRPDSPRGNGRNGFHLAVVVPPFPT